MAVLKSLSGSCLLRSSMAENASYMIRSAVDFLPRIIMMLTNFATSRLPYFGSGITSRLAAPALRTLGSGGALGRLRAVLRARLLAIGHAGGVEAAADDVVPDAGEILHAAPPDHHDRVLLEVVPHARDIRRDLEPVRQPDARDLPQRRVRFLGGRRVAADADPALLRAGLHRSEERRVGKGS